MTTTKPVRVRFAPSPTGKLHIGGARTAIYNWAFARATGGTFVLRIEDTDQEREVPGAVELIYKSLREAGLEYDEGPDVGGDYGPYIQTQRRDTYLPYAMQLVESGAAYPCFCTKEELQARRDAATARGEQWKYDKHCLNIPRDEALRRMQSGEPFVIRQNIPLTGTASFDDALYGHVEAPCDTLDDNVLIKADGLPTYNFANVIDDHLMGITHVMRGTEYLSSAPKYNLLYEAFGWQPPIYIHLSPVMKDATRKLSKRYGDPSFEDLLAQGYVRDAIINFIALLGWSPGDEREFFTLEELVEAFDLKGLSKAPAIFNTEKLVWFNHEYIMMKPDAEIACLFRPVLESNGIDASNYSDEFLTKVVSLVKGRVNFVKELWDQTRFFFVAPTEYAAKDVKKRWSEDTPRIMTELMDVLRGIGDFSSKPSEDIVIGWITERGYHMGNVMNAFRLSVVGECKGPHMFDITELIGKEETLARIQRAIDIL